MLTLDSLHPELVQAGCPALILSAMEKYTESIELVVSSRTMFVPPYCFVHYLHTPIPPSLQLDSRRPLWIVLFAMIRVEYADANVYIFI